MREVGGMKLDQFWECPKCSVQVAMGEPAHLAPPFCSFGHSRTEMEQVAARRFGAQEQDDA